MKPLVPLLGLALAACAPHASPTSCPASGSPSTSSAPSTSSTPSTPPSAPSSTTGRHFGGGFDPAVEDVALASVVASPETFQDRTIRTSGTIVRVCQRMGCWMEMHGEGTEAVRVPMAGHAFFLPRDVAGRPTRIQGTVRLVALSAGAREHLASEGAQAVTSTLAIEASAVDVD